MSKDGDGIYDWLDDFSPDPPEPRPADARTEPEAPPLPASSPDGTVTYTSTDNSALAQSYGAPGTTAATEPETYVPYTPQERSRKRSTGTGSAGKPARRGGFLGFLGRFFKIRLILGAVGLAIAGIAALFGIGEGTTSVRSLEPGDCFEYVEEDRLRNVKVQDCALAHGAEMFAEVQTFEDDIVGEMCLEEAYNLNLDFDRLPADVRFGYFEGTLTHRCTVASPSGQLVGSILD